MVIIGTAEFRQLVALGLRRGVVWGIISRWTADGRALVVLDLGWGSWEGDWW